MNDHPTLPFDETEPPERWVPVLDFEGMYEVSDLGRVWSHQKRGGGKRGGFLKPILQGAKGNRYEVVCLFRNGVRHYRAVHELVAEHFIGPRPEGQIVRHGPGGRLDNRAVNLGYGTYRQNTHDRYRDGTMNLGEDCNFAKLTEAKVREIRLRFGAGEAPVVLAAEFGVTSVNIAFIVQRKTWKHVA